jgi:hypothetical protein
MIFVLKKKEDSDILTFNQCMIENQSLIMDTTVLGSEYEYRKIHDDHIKKNEFKSMGSLSPQKTSIQDFRDMVDYISSDLPSNGFIEDKHYSFYDEKSFFSTHKPMSKCNILKDWLKCYKEQDKTGKSKNWKYIEKSDNLFIDDKICTISINDSF